MAFVATHQCTRCGASQDRRNTDDIREKRGVANRDCVIDNGHRDGHNFQTEGIKVGNPLELIYYALKYVHVVGQSIDYAVWFGKKRKPN